MEEGSCRRREDEERMGRKKGASRVGVEEDEG